MNEAGLLCQALAVRVHTGADPEWLGRNLDRATAGSPNAGTRLWIEDVAEGPDSAAAARQRSRELSRPVDPETGPGLRVVLLRYRDGAADLIMVVHRASVPDPHTLLGALLIDPEPLRTEPAETGERLRAGLDRLDRTAAPDWGLGEPGRSTVGRYDFTAPAAREGRAQITSAAALGLVLARCTGAADVVLGVDAEHSLAFSADERLTVSAYLDGVLRATAAPVPGLEPVVGLVVTEPAEVVTGTGVKAEVLEHRPFLAPVHPLSVHVADDGAAGLVGTSRYRHSVFDDEVVRWLTGMLVTAHGALTAADPDAPLGSLDLFDQDQLRRLAVIGGLGRTPDIPKDRIDQVIRSWAERTPDATAVSFEDTRLTYRELDERAGQAAHALRALGVGAGDRVGVSLDRSLDLVVVLLAVLKSGAAYVPMDPAYPADRLSYTAEDAGLSVVVTDSADFPALDGVRTVGPGSLAAGERPAVPPEPAGDSGGAAYVIYTSGSTGRPKGVVVPHRNVAGLLAATKDDFGLGERDVWTLFHSSAFDFSVWEIWGCLMTGGRLVVVPYWASRDPEEFATLLDTEQVTVLNQTPSAFSQLMAVDQEKRVSGSVRLVVFGGEPLDTGPLRLWQDRHPDWECRLVNMFGITETTVHVTAQTVTRREALSGSRSVGAALPGWHVYVLDGAGRPLPPGVAGEIYVGGVGVAGQYLNRPELTEERFLPDPFAPGPMYRSGDRGRLLPDGRLEHLGRLDNQVKLRGFRIELGEIRARLLDAPSVVAAAVVLRQDPADAAGARLDGYVVLTPGSGDAEEVRKHAARFLPEHMVPSTVTVLPALPLTPNGKVDTARLPEPLLPTHADDTGDDTVEDADVESRLKSVWEKVFGFRIGLDDDFFDLGGNSLLGVRLSAAVRAAGLPAFPLSGLYLNRTVRSLAATLDGAKERT
ncbi:amino acid adenylation domain-containing protein [Streptomyces sp. AK02-01A]|uniref:non-ribosomal peptide synthetase n=1 Tax=Streptomyces sp. AK02-01A TaxID=3028648 RepID=UPI0029B30676|nr:amino acid adenylation domain-containing protein [Streptomyces sp. AK02-01A]MDX3854287.1 amino acid adenylation domain-containing protein [Streptomyces sp. AK02-01A]